MRLSKSDEEITKIFTFIRKFINIAIEIELNRIVFKNDSQNQTDLPINSKISTKVLNESTTRYSLKINPNTQHIRFIIFNLLISGSICLGFVKLYLDPGINSLTGRFIIDFYNERMVFSLIFLILLIIRLYLLFEVVNLNMNFDVDKDKNELKITFKKFLHFKLLSINQLNKIKNVELVRTNSKNCFSIEITSSLSSIIDYPLKYEDALQCTLLIKKSIKF